MSADAARRLSKFLDDVEVVLKEVADDPTILPTHERAEFARLWRDSGDAVGELQTRLGAIEQGSDRSPPDALARVGLEGASLDVKLAAVDRALFAFRQATAKQGSQAPAQRPRGRRRIMAQLRRRWGGRTGWPSQLVLLRLASLLRLINVPLESLVAALGQGETLKEVKKWLEAVVADVRESQQPPGSV